MSVLSPPVQVGVWGEKTDGGHPHEMGVAKGWSRCDSSQGALNGVGTLSAIQWRRACLAPSKEHILLPEGGENHLLFLPGSGVLDEWVCPREMGFHCLKTITCQPYGLALFSAPLVSDDINLVLVGSLSCGFLQILESNCSSQGPCLKGNKNGRGMERRWKERAKKRCVCVCVFASPNMEGVGVVGSGKHLSERTAPSPVSSLAYSGILSLWAGDQHSLGKICKEVQVCLSLPFVFLFNVTKPLLLLFFFFGCEYVPFGFICFATAIVLGFDFSKMKSPATLIFSASGSTGISILL